MSEPIDDDPYTGFANTGRVFPRFLEEVRHLRRFGQALAGYPMLVGFNQWVRCPADTSEVLILSHFAPDKYSYVREGSDWTSAFPLDPADFSSVAGIRGDDRRWRATILVKEGVENIDDAIKWGLTSQGSLEFDFPFRIASENIFWSPTNW